MTCKYCQKEIRDGLTVCPECGKRLVELKKREKQEKKYLLPAIIIAAVTAVICITAVVLVSLQMPQKKPSELFVDYDVAFTGYELVTVDAKEYADYTYDYNADIYNRENMVNVYFTLTNLTDHEVMLDKIEDNDMTFTLWAQNEIKDRESLSDAELREKLDETAYNAYGMRGNFYDANNRIIRYYFNQKSLLPGESVNAVITMKDDINGGLNFYSSYVEVSYNGASFYWDLEDNRTTGVDLKDPEYPDKEKLSEEEYEAKMREYRKAQYEFEQGGGVMF